MKRTKRYGQKTQRNPLHLTTRSLAKLRRQKRHLMAPLTSVNGLCSSLREQVSFYKHEDAVLVKWKYSNTSRVLFLARGENRDLMQYSFFVTRNQLNSWEKYSMVATRNEWSFVFLNAAMFTLSSFSGNSLFPCITAVFANVIGRILDVLFFSWNCKTTEIFSSQQWLKCRFLAK